MQDYPVAQPSTRRSPDFKLWALTLLVLFSLCFRLGAMPLQSPDEGRYAESAREMLETGDWLIPHFGYVERVNKPPLFYWTAAASMRLFGVNETAARLPSLLAALAIALILYLIARKAWDESAAQATALVLLTSLLFAALARTAITDMLLCFGLTAAAATMWWAIRDRSVPATLLFFVAAAAGTLTKGPVALALPGLIGVLYVSVTRQWRQVRWLPVVAGVVLYAALAVPWFAAVQARYPGFLHYFFIGENLQRFAGNEHPEPLWYYVPILIVGFGVWLPSLVTSLAAAAQNVREKTKLDDLTVFALLWAGVIFAFFSLSKGKLPTYILPCFPPLALLIGRQWAQAGQQGKPSRWTRWSSTLIAAGLAAVAIAVPLLVPRFATESLSPQSTLVMMLTAGAGAIAVGYAAIRGAACTQFGAIAAAGTLFTVGASDIATHLLAGNGGAAAEIARVMTESPPDTRLYTYQEDGLTALRFYLGRTLGSSRRLQDVPALMRPPIDEAAAAVPAGKRHRIARRKRRESSPTSELAEALQQPGPILVMTEQKGLQRLRPLLRHTGADEVRKDAGKYVVVGRLTVGPSSGKSPDREPVTGSSGLKVR